MKLLKTVTLILAVMFVFAATSCNPDVDLIAENDGPPPNGFCRKHDSGELKIVVRNLGNSDIPDSTWTKIEFFPGGYDSIRTPPVPAGSSVTLRAVRIPDSCFDSDCEFTITVDHHNKVKETDESNSFNGLCIG